MIPGGSDQATSVGMPDSQVKLTLTSHSGTSIVCNPVSACYTNLALWPPLTPSTEPDNLIGKVTTLRADYIYRPTVAMVFGGKAVSFGAVNLYGYSRQLIAF